MNWHKTNIAIITILLLIDIFMAIMLINAYKSAKLMPQSFIGEAKNNLSEKQIYFSESNIDKKIRSEAVYTFSPYSFANTIDDENPQNQCLLNALSYLSGNAKQNIQNHVRNFEIPEGIEVSVQGKEQNALTSVIISKEDKHKLRYTKSGHTSADFEKNIETYFSDLNPRSTNLSCPAQISSFIKSVYNDTLKVNVLKSFKNDEFNWYFCSYNIGGVEISDLYLTFCISKNEIIHIYGDFIFNLPKPEYNAKIVDGVNILFNIPEHLDKPIYIISQSLTYTVFEFENSKNYLIPLWNIKYSDKKNDISSSKNLFFNALTGEYQQIS